MPYHHHNPKPFVSLSDMKVIIQVDNGALISLPKEKHWVSRDKTTIKIDKTMCSYSESSRLSMQLDPK